MPRYDDGPTRLYVGRLSTRTRSRDLEAMFSKYGRVREVDIKHDFAFVEFSDPRDADDARHSLNGREFEGHRIIVEFARRGPRGGGGSGGRKDYAPRGPPPGTGRCYNCGNDGHWARDCKAGDWKDKCYRCGERGHIERNCRNSPRAFSRYERSASRSRSRSHSADRADRADRKRSRSRSPRHHGRSGKYSRKERSASPVPQSKTSALDRSLSPDNSHRRRESRSPTPKSPGENGRSMSRSPGVNRADESPNGVLKED